MKKVIVFLIFLITNILIIYAKDYKIIGIRGKCEIKNGKSWQLLKDNDIITPPSVIRGVENDATISILKLGTNEVYKKILPQNLPVSFNPKESSILSSFFSFLLTPTKAIMLSAQHGGHSTKGNYDFYCDSISASLFAKIDGKFEVGKIISIISDYDVYMIVDEIPNITEKRFTIFNLSEEDLYIVILKVSKENPKNIHSFYNNSLLEIEQNSIIELPETIISSAFDYILLASANEFIIEDLLNSITSDCNCMPKSDIPIGIYLVK